MKAWILKEIGDISYEDVPVPVSKVGEVLVKVMAAGICGSDIPRIYLNGAHKMPLIPGHEFSGVVEECGKGAPEIWLGKRVGIYPLIPCRKCPPCKNGDYEMCRSYNYLGSRCDGGFAEYVTVPAANLIELPKEATFEEAAMLEPMAVAVHAIRQVQGKQDGVIAVCGLGTIGLLIVMFLKDMGFNNIYVIGNKDFQKRCAVSLGIPEDHYIDNGRANTGKAITDYLSDVDLFFECVGRNECVNLGIELAAPKGDIVLVGNPYSDMLIPKDTYWKILRKQLRLYGTWNSSFNGEEDDWHYVCRLLAERQIDPARLITHRFSLSELDKGLNVMKEKSEDYCKVMIEGLHVSDNPTDPFTLSR